MAPVMACGLGVGRAGWNDTGGRAASGTGQEQAGGGFALGLGKTQLLGGSHGLGRGGGGEALEGGEGGGLGALGNRASAMSFDASVGLQRFGDTRFVEPGLEPAQRDGVDVAEVEYREVRIQKIAKQSAGIRGRRLVAGVRSLVEMCCIR